MASDMADNPSLKLVVLKSDKVGSLLKFYEYLGIHFKQEQHGSGPQDHSVQMGATLLELCPLGSNHKAVDTSTRLGFGVADLKGTLNVFAP